MIMRVRLTVAALFAVLTVAGVPASAVQPAPAAPMAAPGAAPAATSAAAVTAVATADTYVASDTPTRAFGTGIELIADASPVKAVYLKFTVSGLTEPVATARLRLHTRDTDNAASPSGGRVAAVTNTDWSEATLTYGNRPAVSATTLATIGAVARNRWYEVDVTPAVVRDGTLSFAITSGNADSVYYDSRERAGFAPQLVVTTAPPSTTPDPVLLAAGDIADCASAGDEATAALRDPLGGPIAALGDTAYLEGTAQQFAQCYDPSWGRHKARTRPAVGNHEYRTPGAAGYYGYFGAAAGDPAKGYYAYDLGQWHVIVLNSNCSFVSCAAGSAQERWLRAELAANPRACTLAYWHHPLFTSSTKHGPYTEVRPLFQALYDGGADLLLTGHNHNYERFAPQNPQGQLDTARGLREFVVGTGGASLYPMGTPQPNSEARDATTYGVLRLTLRPTGYDWLFVPQAGRSYTDAGSGACH
jgi:hypothetical protein